MSFLAKCRDEGLLSVEAFQQLDSFADLILQWNPRINLTGMRSKPQVEENLFGDCILAVRTIQLAEKRVLDFGSGAGIPGLVWLILEPTLRLTSLEVRAKKVAFQKEVARKLKLNAEILCGLFPDAVQGREFDVIATRAIRFDAKLWEASEGLLHKEGLFVRFGGQEEAPDGWNPTVLSERSSLFTRKRST